jgi:hypothetical protein
LACADTPIFIGCKESTGLRFKGFVMYGRRSILGEDACFEHQK